MTTNSTLCKPEVGLVYWEYNEYKFVIFCCDHFFESFNESNSYKGIAGPNPLGSIAAIRIVGRRLHVIPAVDLLPGWNTR